MAAAICGEGFESEPYGMISRLAASISRKEGAASDSESQVRPEPSGADPTHVTFAESAGETLTMTPLASDDGVTTTP